MSTANGTAPGTDRRRQLTWAVHPQNSPINNSGMVKGVFCQSTGLMVSVSPSWRRGRKKPPALASTIVVNEGANPCSQELGVVAQRAGSSIQVKTNRFPDETGILTDAGNNVSYCKRGGLSDKGRTPQTPRGKNCSGQAGLAWLR
jgi:hypothetical protein